MKSDRTLALEWWRNFDTQQKKEVVKKWQESLSDTDFKKSWGFEMIEMSSSTIQLIWENAK